ILSPVSYFDEYRPLGQLAIFRQMFHRIPREQQVECRFEQVSQRQVDGPDSAVKIQRPKQLPTRLHEMEKCVEPLNVQSQSFRSEKRIVEQAIEVEGAGSVTGHVTVPQDEVHVVDGIDASEQTAQEAQPSLPRIFGFPRPLDQVSDVFGLQYL